MTATVHQNEQKKTTAKNVRPNPNRKKQNRIMQFFLLAIIILLTIFGILVAINLLSSYNSRNTFEYQYNASVSAYESAEYDKALNYVDRALELEDSDETKITLAKELKYTIYIAKKDYNSAITVLLQLLEIEENEKRYSSLLELYAVTGNYAQIDELGAKLENTPYYDIYKNYMVGNISVSLEGGDFTEGIKVELTASKSDLVIHYTTDGSKPTVESDVYNNPLEFTTDGTYVLRAVGVSARGTYSEEITETYTIRFDRPENPVVTPDTGEYAEEVTIEVTGLKEGEKAYYTLDGTRPTVETAEEYTEAIKVKPGINVFAVMVVNENGFCSDIVWRMYEYMPKYTIEYDTAVFKVKNKLMTDNMIIDLSGNTSEGTVINVNFVDITSIAADATNNLYYVFNITSEYNGMKENFDGYYCVSVDNGTLLEVNSIN